MGFAGGDLSPLYLLSAILGVVAIAESTVVVKGFPRAHPVTTNAVGMGTGAVLLILASLVLGDHWALPTMARTWFAIAWLVGAGSVALFKLYLYVVMQLDRIGDELRHHVFAHRGSDPWRRHCR
ncbi:MAG: hypothetical protein M3346_10705 [Actinomycetota bacterium]|nr:hypothetical protein [Actinomycetota bacterium]